MLEEGKMDLYQAMMKVDGILKDAGLDKGTYQSQINGTLVLKYDYWEELNPVIVAEINKYFQVDCMLETDEDTRRYIYLISAKKEEKKPHPMDRPNKIGKVKDLLDNEREENPYG